MQREGNIKKEVKKGQELPPEHPIIRKKIDKTLNLSIEQGSYSSAMNGLTSSYFTPYALALNATSSHIGILNAFTSLLPSLVQLKSSKLIERFRRKKILVISTLIQAFVIILIILAGFLFKFNIPGFIWILIGLMCLFYIFGSFGHPAWFSWMGSIVNENERGAYFSKRNKILGFFGLFAIIAGGLILDQFKKTGYVLVGFGVLFSIAFLLRLISTRLIIKQYEPRLKIHKRDYFSLFQFLKKSPETPFGRFTIFATIMRIATNIAGPFFAVYMLKDLGFSYTWFMAITVSCSVFHLILWQLAGKISDRFGNVSLLKMSCVFLSITPFLWLLSSNPWYLLTIPQISGALAWVGFGLATNNYIYDSVRQEKRSFGIAYFNFLTSAGLFIGAGIGAGLALLNIPFMNTLLFIFMISGITRFSVFLIGSRYLQEVRHVKKFSTQFIIREFHPSRGLVREFHRFNHFKEKIIHHA